MRQKIYDRLLQWKHEKNGTTALLIERASLAEMENEERGQVLRDFLRLSTPGKLKTR